MADRHAPQVVRNYWGNKKWLSHITKTLHEWQTTDLNAETSLQMQQWNREALLSTFWCKCMVNFCKKGALSTQVDES